MLTTKQSQTENAGRTKGNAPFFPQHIVQPKLTVNESGDRYEQEADAMADKVMRMSMSQNGESSFFKPAPNDIQRKCQHCADEEKLHRKETSGAEVQGGNELDSYVGSLGSSGQGLSASNRRFFEPRFGHDFSDVKIHTDTVAAKSAQSINALAYTSGNNIVFNSGQYSPESDSGKKLLAHELTHVVQQQASSVQPKTIQKAPAATPTTSEVSNKVTEVISNATAGDESWNGTYKWDSKFEIAYDLKASRVSIVMRLYTTASDAVKASWKTAIESKWGKGQFELEAWKGCLPKVLPIDTEIQWVTDASKAHFTITPNAPGADEGGRSGVGGTTSMTGWGTADTQDITHEFGHMLGNPEEYFTTNGVDYTDGGKKKGFRVNGGGVMNNPAESPMPRHYEAVRVGFTNMLHFSLAYTRVVQHGSAPPPLIACGDFPAGQKNMG